jgi:hypothetical protein
VEEDVRFSLNEFASEAEAGSAVILTNGTAVPLRPQDCGIISLLIKAIANVAAMSLTSTAFHHCFRAQDRFPNVLLNFMSLTSHLEDTAKTDRRDMRYQRSASLPYLPVCYRINVDHAISNMFAIPMHAESSGSTIEQSQLQAPIDSYWWWRHIK